MRDPAGSAQVERYVGKDCGHHAEFAIAVLHAIAVDLEREYLPGIINP